MNEQTLQLFTKILLANFSDVCSYSLLINTDLERLGQLGLIPFFWTQVYVLATSVSERLKRLPFMNNDNEKEFEELDKPERFVYPHIDKFSVQLISPTTWEMVPNAKYVATQSTVSSFKI